MTVEAAPISISFVWFGPMETAPSGPMQADRVDLVFKQGQALHYFVHVPHNSSTLERLPFEWRRSISPTGDRSGVVDSEPLHELCEESALFSGISLRTTYYERQELPAEWGDSVTQSRTRHETPIPVRLPDYIVPHTHHVLVLLASDKAPSACLLPDLHADAVGIVEQLIQRGDRDLAETALSLMAPSVSRDSLWVALIERYQHTRDYDMAERGTGHITDPHLRQRMLWNLVRDMLQDDFMDEYPVDPKPMDASSLREEVSPSLEDNIRFWIQRYAGTPRKQRVNGPLLHEVIGLLGPSDDRQKWAQLIIAKCVRYHQPELAEKFLCYVTDKDLSPLLEPIVVASRENDFQALLGSRVTTWTECNPLTRRMADAYEQTKSLILRHLRCCNFEEVVKNLRIGNVPHPRIRDWLCLDMLTSYYVELLDINHDFLSETEFTSILLLMTDAQQRAKAEALWKKIQARQAVIESIKSVLLAYAEAHAFDKIMALLHSFQPTHHLAIDRLCISLLTTYYIKVLDAQHPVLEHEFTSILSLVASAHQRSRAANLWKNIQARHAIKEGKWDNALAFIKTISHITKQMELLQRLMGKFVAWGETDSSDTFFKKILENVPNQSVKTEWLQDAVIQYWNDGESRSALSTLTLIEKSDRLDSLYAIFKKLTQELLEGKREQANLVEFVQKMMPASSIKLELMSRVTQEPNSGTAMLLLCDKMKQQLEPQPFVAVGSPFPSQLARGPAHPPTGRGFTTRKPPPLIYPTQPGPSQLARGPAHPPPLRKFTMRKPQPLIQPT